MTTFSVLICTCNRLDLLTMSLKALIELTEEKPDEIVVVNGGDERAGTLVLQYANRFKIKVKLVKTVNRNLAASRNVGLPYCTGDIVAMTDDDAEVFPDWVTQMKKIHAEHPEAGVVGGAVFGADSEKSLLSRIADVATFSSPAKPAYVRTIAGVNVSYKRAALQAVGLQDVNLFRGEDVDFNWRIKKLGYEIYYSPEIKVRHYHRATLKQFVYQFYMYGRAYYLVRRKWPEMYCVYPHGVRSPKDVLKAINVFARLIYLPFVQSFKLKRWLDRIYALPVFFLLGFYWNLGIYQQKRLIDDR